ncbi:MAG: hypothetical protein Q8S73_16725 [Deltaproteobacteria bacterium]|nr:hypothetical protein [Deltaproteobacteria bacterium]
MNAVGLDRLDARNPKTGGLAPDLGHAFLDYPADPDGSDWAMSERRVELTVLTPAALELREEALGRVRSQLGRAAQDALRAHFNAALLWAQERHNAARGSYESLARSALRTGWRLFLESHSLARLRGEWNDERWRAAAASNDRALTAYLQFWRGRLRRLQVAVPGRWYVAGLTDEEVLDVLELDLIEAIRAPEMFEQYERSGREATLWLLGARKDHLRRKRRIYAVSKKYELRHLDDYEPTALELLEGHERQRAAVSATTCLPAHLHKPAREWLEHFVRDLSLHGEINPARVADGRKSRATDGGPMHRASATRALQSIQKELVALGVTEALDLPAPAAQAARRPIVQPRRRPRA